MNFEPEFVAGLKTIFEERIVLNQVLGLRIGELGEPHLPFQHSPRSAAIAM